jgi:hypothetical protein
MQADKVSQQQAAARTGSSKQLHGPAVEQAQAAGSSEHAGQRPTIARPSKVHSPTQRQTPGREVERNGKQLVTSRTRTQESSSEAETQPTSRAHRERTRTELGRPDNHTTRELETPRGRASRRTNSRPRELKPKSSGESEVSDLDNSNPRAPRELNSRARASQKFIRLQNSKHRSSGESENLSDLESSTKGARDSSAKHTEKSEWSRHNTGRSRHSAGRSGNQLPHPKLHSLCSKLPASI